MLRERELWSSGNDKRRRLLSKQPCDQPLLLSGIVTGIANLNLQLGTIDAVIDAAQDVGENGVG